jgi:hypothetical protein
MSGSYGPLWFFWEIRIIVLYGGIQVDFTGFVELHDGYGRHVLADRGNSRQGGVGKGLSGFLTGETGGVLPLPIPIDYVSGGGTDISFIPNEFI